MIVFGKKPEIPVQYVKGMTLSAVVKCVYDKYWSTLLTEPFSKLKLDPLVCVGSGWGPAA